MKWFATWIIWVLVLTILFTALIRCSPSSTTIDQSKMAQQLDDGTISKMEKIAKVDSINAETEVKRATLDNQKAFAMVLVFFVIGGALAVVIFAVSTLSKPGWG